MNIFWKRFSEVSMLPRSEPVRRLERGIALLEALIALLVTLIAFATIMSFHGDVVGRGAENRLVTVAMNAAQEQLENLRSQAVDLALFDGLSNSESSFQATVPRFGAAQQEVTLKRCTVVSNGPTPSTRLAQVWIERSGACGAGPSDSALAAVSALVTFNDLRLAALRTAFDRAYDPDGEGEIIENPVIDEDETPVPLSSGDPGFERVVLGGNRAGQEAIFDPDTNRALTGKDGASLRFATINGNIFMKGRDCAPISDANPESAADRCGLDIVVQGNALCRLNDSELAGDDFPKIQVGMTASATADFSHLRYTCVVADQWRRSVVVSPRESTARACPAAVEAALVGESASARRYDGRRLDDGEVVPHGLRGVGFDALSPAVIGSYCVTDDDCWQSPNRGLVPGGHHFVITDGDAECDFLGPQGPEFVGDVLRFTPRTFYCTNAKDYVPIEQVDGSGDPVRDANGNVVYINDVCGVDLVGRGLGGTVLSGFVNNGAAVGELEAGGTFMLAEGIGGRVCNMFGPFGTSGAAFDCVTRHFWGAANDGRRLLARSFDVVVEPAAYEGLYAQSYPLDGTDFKFEVTEPGSTGDGGNNTGPSSLSSPQVAWSLPSTNSRSLTWGPVSDAEEYLVLRCTRGNVNALTPCDPTIVVDDLTTLTYSVDRPANKQTVCYTVSAVAGLTRSEPSDPFCAFYAAAGGGTYDFSP